MIEKENVIKVINDMVVEESINDVLATNYINKIQNMPDTDFTNLVNELGVSNDEQIRDVITERMSQTTDMKFNRLNETIGYNTNEDTLHIHVMPEELKDALSKEGRKRLSLELIDALEKIQDILKNDVKCKDVKQVYAVSGLLRGPILDMFNKLEFDTRCLPILKAKDDKELSKFYEHFKDKKYLGSANLLKEKLFSKEWYENKEKIKHELMQELGIKENESEEKSHENSFQAELKGMVNAPDEIANKDVESSNSINSIERNKNKEEKFI